MGNTLNVQCCKLPCGTRDPHLQLPYMRVTWKIFSVIWKIFLWFITLCDMRNTFCDMRNTFCDTENTFCTQCCKYHVKQAATHMTYTRSCLIWARQPPITNTTRHIATISPVSTYPGVHRLPWEKSLSTCWCQSSRSGWLSVWSNRW